MVARKYTMPEGVDKNFEIEPNPVEKRTETSAQFGGIKKTSILAKISFISGMSVVLIEGLSVVIVKAAVYDPLWEMLGVISICFSLILLPVSVITGIAALIRIAFNRKRFCGCALAIAGIIVSIVSFVIYGYILITDMFERMMA
jgi:hypothetical protein